MAKRRMVPRRKSGVRQLVRGVTANPKPGSHRNKLFRRQAQLRKRNASFWRRSR